MTAKLELYRVFREVAETGNISAAAQNLYISQSAVSQSVKQLEGALQTRLFIRSPRGVTLTDDGQMLFEHVRSAMGLLETGEEKLAQTRALQMGKLVIGAGGNTKELSITITKAAPAEHTITNFCCRTSTHSTRSTRTSIFRSSAGAATRCSASCARARWTWRSPRRRARTRG